MAITNGEITLPTTLGGERVVCVFPVIGGERHSRFVDAEVVTVATEDAHGNAATFRVNRFTPSSGEGRVISCNSTIKSFPEAVREARKRAGWG